MIEGAKWQRWVYFYIPMAGFLVWLLFPFYWMVITTIRPDGELYRPWTAPNYQPFWTDNPTFAHLRYLFEKPLFAPWLWHTMLIPLAAPSSEKRGVGTAGVRT